MVTKRFQAEDDGDREISSCRRWWLRDFELKMMVTERFRAEDIVTERFRAECDGDWEISSWRRWDREITCWRHGDWEISIWRHGDWEISSCRRWWLRDFELKMMVTERFRPEDDGDWEISSWWHGDWEISSLMRRWLRDYVLNEMVTERLRAECDGDWQITCWWRWWLRDNVLNAMVHWEITSWMRYHDATVDILPLVNLMGQTCSIKIHYKNLPGVFDLWGESIPSQCWPKRALLCCADLHTFGFYLPWDLEVQQRDDKLFRDTSKPRKNNY